MFAFVLTCGVAIADDPMGCVSELTMPRFYRGVAGLAPVSGTAYVTIDEHGRVGSFRADVNPRSALNVELEVLFKEMARYSPSCAGRTLSFIVEYAVLRKPPEADPIPTIRFRAPNRFIVEFAPLLPIADTVPHKGVPK